MDTGLDIRRLIHDGGFIMIPLVVCSVVATIVAVERAIALLGARRRGRELARDVLALVQKGRVEAARDRCSRSRSPLAEVLDAALARAGSVEHAGAAVDRARAEAGHDLRSGLWVLGTIGAAAPFVGLFGTVVGILASFQKIAATGQSGFATVAGDISEALIATASGIGVAVIAFVAHNYFQTRVGSLALDWKLRAEELVEALDVAAAQRRLDAVRAAAPPPAPIAIPGMAA
jgi:biopolymer transport protein ExbB